MTDQYTTSVWKSDLTDAESEYKAGQKGEQRGRKDFQTWPCAGKVSVGLLEMLWIQHDVLSLAHYIFTPVFATRCFGGADVPLVFWGARGCVVHWVGTS